MVGISVLFLLTFSNVSFASDAFEDNAAPINASSKTLGRKHEVEKTPKHRKRRKLELNQSQASISGSLIAEEAEEVESNISSQSNAEELNKIGDTSQPSSSTSLSLPDLSDELQELIFSCFATMDHRTIRAYIYVNRHNYNKYELIREIYNKIATKNCLESMVSPKNLISHWRKQSPTYEFTMNESGYCCELSCYPYILVTYGRDYKLENYSNADIIAFTSILNKFPKIKKLSFSEEIIGDKTVVEKVLKNLDGPHVKRMWLGAADGMDGRFLKEKLWPRIKNLHVKYLTISAMTPDLSRAMGLIALDIALTDFPLYSLCLLSPILDDEITLRLALLYATSPHLKEMMLCDGALEISSTGMQALAIAIKHNKSASFSWSDTIGSCPFSFETSH